MTMPANIRGGEIVYWNLPKEEIQESRQQWPLKFPRFKLPEESLGDPLKRALFAIKAPKGTKRLIRPLGERHHWAVVIETPFHDELDYRIEMVVSAKANKLDILKGISSDYANDLAMNYIKEVDRVTNGQVADMLLKFVRGECLAMEMRKNGAVYYVPPTERGKLLEAAEMVKQLGGTLGHFRIAEDDDNQKSILDMLVDDLANAAEAARVNIENRHRADAMYEVRQALDRLAFYKIALGDITTQAGELETELRGLMAQAIDTVRIKNKIKRGEICV